MRQITLNESVLVDLRGRWRLFCPISTLWLGFGVVRVDVVDEVEMAFFLGWTARLARLPSCVPRARRPAP